MCFRGIAEEDWTQDYRGGRKCSHWVRSWWSSAISLFIALSPPLSFPLSLPRPFSVALSSYRQCFDLEGETGIVVRGIGTCVSLIPKPQPTSAHQLPVLLPANIQGGSHAQASKTTLQGSHTQVSRATPQDEGGEQMHSGMTSPKLRLLGRKTSSSDSDGPSSPNKGSGTFFCGWCGVVEFEAPYTIT